MSKPCSDPYTGAILGADRWIAPRHFIWMGDSQAADQQPAVRLAYCAKPSDRPDRWYKENSRELRDTVISKGLLLLGAMAERPGLPVTSSLPRYALTQDFAALFDPVLDPSAFATAAETWRGKHLTGAALGRVKLVRRTASAASAKVAVNFPGGGGIVLPEGPSPAIIKAVVEEFGPRFLVDPRVLWISDSQRKKAYLDADLEEGLQIRIDVAKVLPDLIMVDLAPPGRQGFLLVFVEAVASEGPVDEQRQADLVRILTSSPMGYTAQDAAFVTAYLDKTAETYRRTAHEIAWGSFAWFVSEPDSVLQLHEATTKKLGELL